MRYKIAFALIGFGIAGAAHAQTFPYTENEPNLTYAGAVKIMQAAAAEANALHAPSNIAVVDRAGDLLAFERMPGAAPASADISIGKARTAARMERPTQVLEDAINTNRLALVTAGLTMMQGGVPIVVDGSVVGAIGISGSDKGNDVKIADTAAKLP